MARSRKRVREDIAGPLAEPLEARLLLDGAPIPIAAAANFTVGDRPRGIVTADFNAKPFTAEPTTTFMSSSLLSGDRCYAPSRQACLANSGDTILDQAIPRPPFLRAKGTRQLRFKAGCPILVETADGLHAPATAI